MVLHRFLYFIFLAFAAVNSINGQLPDQLDPFLEKLFEFEECEEFISSAEFTNIATSDCEFMTCDFPRQLCARPASKFQDKTANVCRNIPTECLTAANGGKPIGPSAPKPMPNPFIPSPTQPNIISPMLPPPAPSPSVNPRRVPKPRNPLAICKMDAPTGRFCGFRPMFTYNKETLQCDEFWFPGCRTAETNDNLFVDYQECQKIADLCRPTPAPTPFRPQTPPPTTPRTFTRPPETVPPPPAPSPIVDAFKSFGGGNSGVGQGALGALGMFTGSGLGATGQGPLGSFAPGGGQTNPGAAAGAATGGAGNGGEQPDLGLFGLIQQGIMGAQAAKSGGDGKAAASQAAGKILEQFTGFDLGGLGNNFGGLFGG